MKRALVISGGGSKGAFAVGVLQALKSTYPRLRFDHIIGTSTGALIAPFAASGELNLLQTLYTTLRTTDVITRHRLGDRLNQKSIYTAEPLWQLIKAHLTDARYNQLLQNAPVVSVTTVCMQTRQLVVWSTKPFNAGSGYISKVIRNAEQLRLAVLASASQPVFMTPVKIEFNDTAGAEKEFQYVDGGLRAYAGVDMAIDNGADEVFAVLMAAQKSQVDNSSINTLFPMLERTLDVFSTDVADNDVVRLAERQRFYNYLQAVQDRMKTDGVPANKLNNYFAAAGADVFNRGVRLFTIQPQDPLGGGPGGLNFDPMEMQGMLATGKLTTQDFVAGLKPKDVTWA